MTASTSSAPSTRYAMLDHWRGFAALAVMLFHATNYWMFHPAPVGLRWFTAITRHGWLGVNLFFVISGYCVAQLAWRELHGERSIAGFLRNRILRIYPTYWATCLFAAAIALAAIPFNHAPVFDTGNTIGALPASFSSFLGHALLINPFVGQPNYLLVAWTLSWEVAYYFLTAALMLLALQFGWRAALGVALALAAAGLVPAVTAFWPALGGWTEFACGIAVFAALTARAAKNATWPWLTVITLFGVVGLLVGAHAIALAAAFALLLCVLHPHDARIARIRPLAWLGAIGVMSYSLYLIHLPATLRLRNLLARFLPDTTATQIGIMLLNVAVSLGAAWLFYRWVEAPLERWRRSLRRPAPVVVTA